MKISPEASSVVDARLIDRLSSGDVPPELWDVIAVGWHIDASAVLLRSFQSSYHGDRARFTDVTGYELAVNGRGIPDLDMTESGKERVPLLLRRGLAFAWAALYELQRSLPGIAAIAFVSVSPTLMDPEDYTGNTTFCSYRAAEPPYVDVERMRKGIMVSLDSTECSYPLSDGRYLPRN